MDVILLGASTRAAAMSARRAGWTPWCADLFADADLERSATVRRVPIDAYPRGLVEAVADAPPGPVIYTGALENRPDLIARIDRPLWGNPPNTLRGVRNPERWTRFLGAHRIPCPAVSIAPQADGRWLLKPRKSAGGIGIRAFGGQPFNPHTHFLQERIDGVPCSAVFLGTPHRGSLLLGVTRQLIGLPWLNAAGYQYCGNIGPLPPDPKTQAAWQYLGNVVTSFPLRGLFGVDAILADGTVWPIEINPRYTASVEVLERSYRRALLPMHRAVFESTPLPTMPIPQTPPICGKAILYARQTFAFPANGPWLASLTDGVDLDVVECADIPHAGDIIERGHPVLTLFASAATVADCERKLQEMAAALDRRLWG